MDYLTGASAFATIVGLIGQFRSEQSSETKVDLKSFQEWLVEEHQEKVKEAINNNSQVVEGLKVMLEENRETFLQKLENINQALSVFSSGINGFNQIVHAINPNAILSKQALSILKEFDKTEASKVLEVHTDEGIILIPLDGNEGNIKHIEQRFIEDDLKTLLEYGLLRHDYNSNGQNLYIFTRSASNLVKEINTNS